MLEYKFARGVGVVDHGDSDEPAIHETSQPLLRSASGSGR
jgi:hypothetical protein